VRVSAFSKIFELGPLGPRAVPPKRLRSGAAALLAGRCRKCGAWVAAVVRTWDPAREEDPEMPSVLLEPMACCVRVHPTEAVLARDGELVMITPLGKMLATAPESVLAPANWPLVLLTGAKPEQKPRLPSAEGTAGRWLERIGRVLRGRDWLQEGLHFVDSEAERISRLGLWADLWELLLALYRAVKDAPGAREGLFALYRGLVRVAAGDRMFAGLRGGEPALLEIGFPESFFREDMGDVREYVWPWDVYAFTFGLWEGPGERPLVTPYRMQVSGAEGPLRHWQAAREGRRYVLAPAGVRAAVRGRGIIRSVLLRERGGSKVAFEIEAEGLPDPMRGWFDWEEGFGFSPWQLTNGFRFEDDPLLGMASELFAELVTAEPKALARKVGAGGARVLPPEEGRVRAEPRVVYFGEPGERGAGSVRRPLPAAERRAPRLHAVAGHLRRITGKASEEARKAAEEYRVALPEGYTFVRPHERGRRGPDGKGPRES
jgi:hypothetical protein